MRQQKSLSRGRLSLAAAFTLVAVLVQPGLADVLGVYFGPRQSIDKPLIAIFDNAQRSIHVAMFSFTLDSYADALIRTQGRGVEVKVVLDMGQARGRGSDARKLEAAGIPVRYGAGSGLMNHKCLHRLRAPRDHRLLQRDVEGHTPEQRERRGHRRPRCRPLL